LFFCWDNAPGKGNLLYISFGNVRKASHNLSLTEDVAEYTIANKSFSALMGAHLTEHMWGAKDQPKQEPMHWSHSKPLPSLSLRHLSGV
jgi:hypothetical protein